MLTYLVTTFAITEVKIEMSFPSQITALIMPSISRKKKRIRYLFFFFNKETTGME